ncbi:MAG: hypothetical protein LBJ62_07085 [Bifidobacteriaceae bacterium]|jgi:nitroreductase|nr:hypothetical protein [Bifidobacteriaceae bacterium]
MDSYSAIFSRHAAHSFDGDPLNQEALQDILALARSADQIEGQSIELDVASPDQVNEGMSTIKGSPPPHYLLAFTEQTDAAFANAGYVLQAVELAVQAKGLGSHWLGMAKPKASRPDYTIALAFGRTSEPARPRDAADRLDLARISDQDNGVAQAVRLAPSGVNDQPWRLAFEDGLVRLIHHPRGAMRLILAKKMDKISLGIAARHAALALQHEGRIVTKAIPANQAGAFAIEIYYT